MTDLNDWKLAYLGQEIVFGTYATQFPFTGQVDETETSATNQDMSHPNSDGMVMGIDRMGGFSLIFTLVTPPAYPQPTKPWVPALDRYALFKNMWRADALRRLPGQYAQLTNLDRNRMVFGRPRKIVPSNARLRKGELRYVAQFDTIDPNWYSGTEKLAVVSPNPASSGGFTAPLTPPFTTAGSNDEVAPMINAGDGESWPTIQIHGPASGASLELLDGGGAVVWRLTITDRLKFDDVIKINTQPWQRGATISGKPATGRLRGTALDRVIVPPGTFNLRYRVTDKSGQSFADIRWRDTYVSM